MDEFDFTDGLKIVLASVFMLGSVQLHVLIDESAERTADRTQVRASPAIHPARHVRDAPTADFEKAELPLSG
jgi:hypothetical protein